MAELILSHIAVRIAQALQDGDLIYLADDEQQADAVATMVAALNPLACVILVPSSDALPGDAAPPSPANAGRRVAALRKLRRAVQATPRDPIALILSGEAAARRYPPPEAFDRAPPVLTPGDPIDISALGDTFAELGYIEDDRVDEPGEVAIRGDVIDIFPADSGSPARVEIADGAVSAIRAYDPSTQRTTDALDRIEIGRAAEPELGDAVAILQHIPAASIAVSAKADSRRGRFIDLAAEAAARTSRPIDAIDEDRWARAIEGWTPIAFDDAPEPLPRFAESRSPFAALARHIEPLLAEGRQLVLAGHRRDLKFLRPRLAKRLDRPIAEIEAPEQLRDLLSRQSASPAAGRGISKRPSGKVRSEATAAAVAIEMPCDAGFVDDRLIVVAAADLLGSRALLGDTPSQSSPAWDAVAADIRCGDIVIHEDHGIALVTGLEPAPLIATEAVGAKPEHADDDNGAAGEMIALEFAKGGRRLVTVDEADRLWRYGADADAVTLDTLNGGTWEKRRATISAAIDESAKGLSELAAARAKLEAVVIDPDKAAYERFAGGFPFNETADQIRAINAVRADLASGRPMDRLVVGDVGYGKTEVALRAAALAALAGQQVIVAAPTTVLVRQHVESFRKRFAGTGIEVESLSRLSTAAEKKRVKAGLADGSIDVVIGTAAVVAKGVAYNNLALVVIDEEQRFGAADKLRLRGDGRTHLLTLSATPIPRTLQMALVKLQQMSLITTPPARRQPIRTSLDSFDEGRIRTALLREKGRGGQSFVVVPRIEDMAKLAERLQRIVPDLAVIQAHGKMPAAEIDEAMVAFAGGSGDILLATNIIEAGLDVPRANTMIVWRADRFGLAQLHQLRGRVGRGNRRGQVILLTEREDTSAERTLKRLRTLATFDQLGAGFDISAQDLDMRGSGDLLGDTQAGHIKLIGTDLYQHLLTVAMRTARGETVDRWSPELHLGGAGALPESWIPEADVRLSLYVRLARLSDDREIDAFEDELVDRFGPLPPAAERLLAVTRLRITACALGIARIDAGPAAIALTLREDFQGDADAAGLVEKSGRFILSESTEEPDRLNRIQTLLETLAA